MSKTALEENVLRHFHAIDLCLENNLLMPALVMIYNGIDIVAALNRDSTKERVDKHDFIKWCENYLIPESSLSCKGIDLYAARCGILHTYTAVSDLSKKGEASEIIYFFGEIEKEKYQKIIDANYSRKVIIESVDNLYKAFKHGFFKFVDDIKSQPEKELLVYERANHFFIDRASI